VTTGHAIVCLSVQNSLYGFTKRGLSLRKFGRPVNSAKPQILIPALSSVSLPLFLKAKDSRLVFIVPLSASTELVCDSFSGRNTQNVVKIIRDRSRNLLLSAMPGIHTVCVAALDRDSLAGKGKMTDFSKS
jgi:hypothetical protein